MPILTRSRKRKFLEMSDETLNSLAEAISRVHISRVPPPAMCTGTGIREFFIRFERFAYSSFGDDADIWIQVLPDYLSGEAKSIALAHGENASYRIVKEKLMNIFNQANRNDAYTNFFSAKREYAETLRCYSIRLQALAGRVDATADGRMVLVRSKLMNGLAPRVADQLKVQLCHMDTCSIDTFVKVASTIESIESGKTSMVIEDINAISRQDTNPSQIKCYDCGEIGHVKRNCPKNKQKEFRCFRCNKTGHFARNCNSIGGYQDSRTTRGQSSAHCLFCGGEHLMKECREFRESCMICCFCGDSTHKSFQCSRNPSRMSGN